MTTLFVIQLDLDHLPSGTTLQDVIDVSNIATNDWPRDDLWISAFSTRVSPQKLQEVSSKLAVDANNILLSSKSVNAQAGSELIADAIAYSKQYDNLVLYDCNRDVVLIERDFTGTGLRTNSAYMHFRMLDHEHRNIDLAAMANRLEELVTASETASSSAGETLRFLARPLARYIRTYRTMLLKLAPDKSVGSNSGEYDALRNFTFTDEMARLIYLQGELKSELRELDFVRSTLDFFQFGANSMDALGRLDRHPLREGLSATLGWWTSYYFAAGKEFANLGLNSNALLNFCRAFETYILAHLWRRGGVELDWSSNCFVLEAGKEPGMASLWHAIRDEEPDIVRRFSNRFHATKRRRNANVLVHGFHFPDAASVATVQSFVKEFIGAWDGSLSRGSRIIRGRIARFFRGLESDGGLGKTLASAIVRRSRAKPNQLETPKMSSPN